MDSRSMPVRWERDDEPPRAQPFQWETIVDLYGFRGQAQIRYGSPKGWPDKTVSTAKAMLLILNRFYRGHKIELTKNKVQYYFTITDLEKRREAIVKYGLNPDIEF